MKNIKLLLIGLLVITSFTACKKSPEKLLIGKWKLSEVIMPNLTDEAVKQEYYAKVTFEFMENGNYDIAGFKEGGDQGKWELSEDGKSITSISSDGKKDVSTIAELTADKLIMTQADTKMTLTKVK